MGERRDRPSHLMAFDLKKIPQGDINHVKGVWKGARRDGIRTANMSCPSCGKIQSLCNHFIDDQGKVNPSVDCYYKCGFHEFIQLESWDPNEGMGDHGPTKYVPKKS